MASKEMTTSHVRSRPTPLVAAASNKQLKAKRNKLWDNVADLFRQLFFAELVQNVELLRKNDVLQESVAGQLDAHNDLSVGHHHCHRSELDFEVFRQLLTPGVTRVLQSHIIDDSSPYCGKLASPCSA